MKYKEITTDYWFTIEPYVFISIVNNSLLLYNTLDGKTIESDKADVIELLGEILKKENCGVTLLKKEVYKHDDINAFVCELREKFMGDVIDVSLSKGKPVQLLPFFNLSNKHELYKKMNFSPRKNILENLSEISIYVDCKTDEANLFPFFIDTVHQKISYVHMILFCLCHQFLKIFFHIEFLLIFLLI